jgi:glycosyltransferase involved in cell wall biosynthesis
MALIAFDARDAFLPMPHGSGIYVRRLLVELQTDAHLDAEHTLWALTRGGPGPEVLWEQGGLAWALVRHGAELVHGPDSFLPLLRRCPGVVTVHDLAFAALDDDMPARTQRKYRLLVPAAVRSADRVICPSEFTAVDLETRYGVAREKIRVIPEAPALASGHAPAPEGPYVLAVGDLRPKKNLGVLIDAFRRLHADGLPHRLILAGADLGQGAALLRRAGEAPVQLAGFLSDLDLDALLRGADAFVMPSLYEGFGLAALDAMARGCPTLLARAGALPEVGGSAAPLFDPGDASALADLLGGVLEDRSRRAAMAEAGRRRAAEFSWAATAAATVAVYEELL